jgi:hypothetical protein
MARALDTTRTTDPQDELRVMWVENMDLKMQVGAVGRGRGERREV